MERRRITLKKATARIICVREGSNKGLRRACTLGGVVMRVRTFPKVLMHASKGTHAYGSRHLLLPLQPFHNHSTPHSIQARRADGGVDKQRLVPVLHLPEPGFGLKATCGFTVVLPIARRYPLNDITAPRRSHPPEQSFPYHRLLKDARTQSRCASCSTCPSCSTARTTHMFCEQRTTAFASCKQSSGWLYFSLHRMYAICRSPQRTPRCLDIAYNSAAVALCSAIFCCG